MDVHFILIFLFFLNFFSQEQIDALKLMEIKGWEHSCKDLAQLDRDRIQINYIDNLTYVFMNRETCLDFKKDLVTLR